MNIMKRLHFFLLGAACFCMLSYQAPKNPLEPQSPEPLILEQLTKLQMEVSFKNFIKPIFIVKCSVPDCHGDIIPEYDTHRQIRKQAQEIRQRIQDAEKPMPPVESGITLSDFEKNKIIEWIDNGTPNN